MKHIYKKIHDFLFPNIKIDKEISTSPGILDQFCRLSSNHNRINRIGFIGNTLSISLVIFMIYGYIESNQYFILGFGKIGLVSLWIIVILLLLFTTWIQSIQIIKRCHDIGNSGKYIVVFYIYMSLIGAFGRYFESDMLMSGGVIFYIGIILYLILIPGEKDKNKYGDTAGF